MTLPTHSSVLRATTLASTAVLLAALSGCGGEDRGRAGAAEGLWTAREAWVLTPELRVGAMEGDGPDVFGAVSSVALDELGRVWVADSQRRRISVFGPGGAHVRSFGGAGSGPAEFRSLDGMDWGPDRHLWVIDAGNARIARYDTAGGLVGTHPRPVAGSVSPWPGRVGADGRLVDVGLTVRPDGTLGDLLVRWSPTSTQPVDTFVLPPFAGEYFEVSRGDARRRHVSRVNVPFTGSQAWAVDPAGHVWVAHTARYRLERHPFEGGAVRAVERPVEPLPVPATERERMLEQYRRFEAEGGRVDESRIPRTYPPLRGFFVASDGYVWVQPATAPGADPVFDVFRRDGRYLGRIASPVDILASPPPAVRGDRIAAVAKDELGVDHVVVLRIHRP